MVIIIIIIIITVYSISHVPIFFPKKALDVLQPELIFKVDFPVATKCFLQKAF